MLGKQRKQELLESYLRLKEEVNESEGALMRLDFQHKVRSACRRFWITCQQLQLSGG